MKILKIFFVGVGLIIGLLLSASIGGAFDNFYSLNILLILRIIGLNLEIFKTLLKVKFYILILKY